MVRRGGGSCQIAPGFSPGSIKQGPWRGGGMKWQGCEGNVGGVKSEGRRVYITLESGEMSF